jgi:GH24 family phage-related lysozyme (muramidase)
MPIDYQDRTDAEYRRRASVLIQNFEGFRAGSYDANDNMATIGFGYTFNRANNVELWDQAGVQLSPTERRQLAAIDAARPDQRTAMGLAFPVQITREEARSLLENASLPRYEGPANNLNMPSSDERAAVVSITYNRGTGRMATHMQGFNDAIADGDRAEAWYQLRYNSRGTNPDPDVEFGLRSRRNMEAHAFGLYDDPQNVTSEEARNVYRMFQLHRDDIQQNERNWGVDFDGTRATRNTVAHANNNWPELSREYGQVPTIAAALEPARERLLADLRTEHPDLADRLRNQDFPTTAIHLDPGRDLRTGNGLRADQRNNSAEDVDPDHEAIIDSRRTTRGANPREIESNDLLIGEGGNDTLRAHRGDDILIGGAGRDRLEGGVGRDTYVVGAGDTVMDNDGRGELHWNGRVLAGGTRADGDPANTWRSADGGDTYALNGSTLTITNRQGESMQVENYARGDLGLRLEDSPARATPGNGDARPEDRPGQAQDALSIERLGPQDRALYDRMHAAVQARGGYTAEQAQNIAAAGLAEYHRRDSLVREPQEVGIYGDRLFTAYFPNGQGREPNFHANVRLDDVANTPARDSLQQIDAQNRERAIVAPAQQQDPLNQQNRQDQEAPTRGGR